MEIYLSSKGGVTGPYTSAQLHRMLEEKKIATDMLYWCEGMREWEKFQPKRDLGKFSSVKEDAHFPFESGAPPPAPPWKKKSLVLRAGVAVAMAVGFSIFFLAWEKHMAGAQEETARSTTALSTGEKYRTAIKAGAAYTQQEWPVAAEAAGIFDMETAQALLGAPNLVNDKGYRWVYFDRMIHPLTAMQADMSVWFGPDKKLQSFSTYP